MATIDEKHDSRVVTVGPHTWAERRYVLRDVADEKAARWLVLAHSPVKYDPWGNGLIFLPRQTVTIEPTGNPKVWEAIVEYGGLPQAAYTFDTGGGTQHIITSRETVAKYPQGAPPNYNLIGVTPDGVEGVDITVPVYQFSETHHFDADDPAFDIETLKKNIFALTGCTNQGGFRGLARGECLFLGAVGSRRGWGDWEITFRFAGSPNVENLSIGDITGIAKRGWEYLWVRYADEVDPDTWLLIKKPIAVYVERVYEEADFSLLGIGS